MENSELRKLPLTHPGGSHFGSTTSRRRVRHGLVALGLLLFGMLGGMSIISARWALHKTREVPDFYLQAKARTPVDPDVVSRQLEREVQVLTDQVGQQGSWHAVFTEDQINAWLVHQLPKEFSKILPRGVHDPRVVIEDGKVLAAARYTDHHIDTVVSFEVSVQLTEVPNVLAVEIRNLKAGALALPLKHFVHHISNRAAYDQLEVKWDEASDGSPIGLITVPSEHPKYVFKPVIVESVELTEGRLWLAGHTGPEAYTGFQPRGPIYQLAALRSDALPENKGQRPPLNNPFTSRL